MSSYVTNRFREVKTIVSEAFASTTANTASSISSSGGYVSCSLMCTAGTIWANPITTATTNSFKMVAGDVLDLAFDTTLSIVSDSTTAKYQAIFWKG